MGKVKDNQNDEIKMLRIKSDRLEHREGRYYLEGELFSGIVYFVVNCKVESIKVCSNGVIGEDYQHPYIDYSQWEHHIDEECFTYEDYPTTCYLNNRLFTGVSYEFHNGELCEEMTYKDGLSRSDYSFKDKDIALYYILYTDEEDICNLEYSEKGCSQIYRVISNKEDEALAIYISFDYRSKTFNGNNNFSFEIDCDFDSKKIERLWISKEYFNHTDIIEQKAKLPIYTNKNFLLNLKAFNEIELGGEGIDDEVFGALYCNEGLIDTNKITIDETSMSDASLQLLSSLPHLNTLIIDSEKFSIEAIEGVKNQNPMCEITYNQVTI